MGNTAIKKVDGRREAGGRRKVDRGRAEGRRRECGGSVGGGSAGGRRMGGYLTSYLISPLPASIARNPVISFIEARKGGMAKNLLSVHLCILMSPSLQVKQHHSPSQLDVHLFWPPAFVVTGVFF